MTPTTEQLKDLLNDHDNRVMDMLGTHVPATCALHSLAPTLAAEVVRLREALETMQSQASFHQEFYDRNGPQWTSPQGNEYEDTSAHLDSMNALAAIARQALDATSDA